MPVQGVDGNRSIAGLVRDLADGSVTIVRSEAHLAKIEVSGAVVGIAKGTGYVAIGAVLALLGVLALITGLVLLIGDQWLPADLYWVAALALFVITGALAAWLAKRGATFLSPSQLAPHETMTTLKEDTEWLKQQLTSDATSS